MGEVSSHWAYFFNVVVLGDFNVDDTNRMQSPHTRIHVLPADQEESMQASRGHMNTQAVFLCLRFIVTPTCFPSCSLAPVALCRLFNGSPCRLYELFVRHDPRHFK